MFGGWGWGDCGVVKLVGELIGWFVGRYLIVIPYIVISVITEQTLTNGLPRSEQRLLFSQNQSVILLI